ncbi:MAG: hypothetical protein WCJ64_04840 [Rhodospirillaceae bacterium]
MTELSANMVGADMLRIQLEGMPNAIRQNILATLAEEGARLTNIVKEEKLEGQVLNRRTGELQASVSFGVEREGDHDVGYISADTAYAARHEYGFIGTEQVREHLRKRFNITDQLRAYFGKMDARKPLSDAKKKSMMPFSVGVVKAHQRTVNYHARSYLRSTIAENVDHIEAALDEAVKDALAILSHD